MTPDEWKRINALFQQAIDLPDSARAAFLAGIADQNERDEVTSLLKSSQQDDNYLTAIIGSAAAGVVLRQNERPARMKPGARVANFEIKEILGTGSFAHVYLANEVSLGRSVALKVSGNKGSEARTMASLEHNHIVQVFSETVDSESDTRLICMQYIPGLNLAELIDELKDIPVEQLSGKTLFTLLDKRSLGGLPLDSMALRDRGALMDMTYEAAALWIGSRVAQGLAFAHKKGVLHLDVKPANILVNPYGWPYVTDFNVSVTQTTFEDTTAAVIGGTYVYMSPEQHDAHKNRDMTKMAQLDSRSDLYSFGLVLLELLARRHLDANDPAGDARRFLKKMPEHIRPVIKRCIAAERNERFSSATEVAEALATTLDLVTVNRALPPLSPTMAWCAESPTWGVLGMALIPQIVGTVINITYNQTQIIANLSHSQQAVFQNLVFWYNITVYPLCSWLLIHNLLPLMRAFRGVFQAGERPSTSVLRMRTLNVSRSITMATTIGWIPGAFWFPFMINMIDGPIPEGVFWHFQFSFAISWLVALTYTILLVDNILVRVFYPRFWSFADDLRSAPEELMQIRRRMRLVQVMAGLIPLCGAAMIVAIGHVSPSLANYYVFQGLVIGLIVLGMGGFLFALKIIGSIEATVQTFTALARPYRT